MRKAAVSCIVATVAFPEEIKYDLMRYTDYMAEAVPIAEEKSWILLCPPRLRR